MIRQRQTMARKTIRKGERIRVRCGNPCVLRSPVESLLRDLALVLHATATVRRDMEAERALLLAAS